MAYTDKEARQALKALLSCHRTQKDAASALGISEAYLSDLKHGRRSFSERILRKLWRSRVIVVRA